MRSTSTTAVMILGLGLTGATAEACARVLLRAGAGAVDVLTLARVVKTRTD